MVDHKQEAARALGEPRWEALGDQHARLWRPGEKPLATAPHERTSTSTTHDGAGHAPRRPARRPTRGGRDRRRAGDADPDAARPHRPKSKRAPAVGLRLPAARSPDSPRARQPSPDAVVAKLRFQQTKIEGAPNTIFVDSEVVAIIRAQQQWVHDHVPALLRDPDAPPPRYLFLASHPQPLRPPLLPQDHAHPRLKQLGELADIRDSQGRRPPLSHVHRFRHTRATSLINAGVPVHVVQRYLGHLSAEMTMRYAHTLARDARARVPALQEDHRRRRRPRTRPARPVRADRARQAHRPGAAERACMLPPRQACNRGNACLTCDKFTTDASYLPEHEQQLGKLSELIAAAPSRVPRPHRRGDGPRTCGSSNA